MFYKNMFCTLIALCCIFSCTKVANNNHQTATFNAHLIEQFLQKLVEDNRVVGVSALVYQGEKEIYFGAFGYADKENNSKFTRDTLVNIYSMTKPVTGAALLSLYEDGLIDFEAPLSQYLPEFSHVQVFDSLDKDGNPVLVEPSNPIRVIDIFRHTACFGYGWEGTYPAQQMNAIQPLDPSKPLEQFSKELATLPLYCQPGQQWKYGVSVDVQARLAEVVAKTPYLDIVSERILRPLKMNNTSYFVEAENKHKLAAVYTKNDNSELSRIPNGNVYGFSTTPPIQTNGGHGLVSSIDDYMRFARMLQNKGSLEGVKVLDGASLDLMSRDHLPSNLVDKDFLPQKGQMGFGLNVAVRLQKPINDDENFGVPGEFFWDGAASTLFWVDPANDLTVVFFTQIRPFDNSLHHDFRKSVYEAFGSLPAT